MGSKSQQQHTIQPGQIPRFWTRSLLLFLGLAAILYISIPIFPSIQSYVTSRIESTFQGHFPSPSFCTEAVGEGACCQLRLEAEPCLDECRKTSLNRQTFERTQMYDECSDNCLVVYQIACGGGRSIDWELRTRSEERSRVIGARSKSLRARQTG